MVLLSRMKSDPSQPVQATLPANHPLFDLVEEAYRVFDYPKPSSTGVCEGCCMDREIEADFFNPSIRRLPLHYIRDWYSGAYDPNGVPKETWAYLLPRLLEVLASGENVSDMGLEVSLDRFGTGNPENWSKTEWRILDNFQKIFLREMIAQKREYLDDTIRVPISVGRVDCGNLAYHVQSTFKKPVKNFHGMINLVHQKQMPPFLNHRQF
jgi:hypothetical protein